MEIIRAKRFAGFCGGVKRAWRLAVREADETGGPVYVSGKLIHNSPAMEELQGKGVEILDILADRPVESGAPFILRAHGEGPEIYAEAERRGLRLIDGTCSIVRTVQRRASELEADGYQVILFGHRNHPEAKATIAHTSRGIIIESVEQASELPFYSRIAAIAQTTSSLEIYSEVCAILREKCEQFLDEGHICDFTQRAQEEAAELAATVDAMVVVGGRDSSNTRRLVEVSQRLCPTYLVETPEDISPEWFKGIDRVGVTAGASTRESDIDTVISRLRSIGSPRPD